MQRVSIALEGIPDETVTNRLADPNVEVPIRERFEDFSSDPEMVDNLKKLYISPDDVDLVVGI